VGVQWHVELLTHDAAPRCLLGGRVDAANGPRGAALAA
jgi:hypothetical protein